MSEQKAEIIRTINDETFLETWATVVVDKGGEVDLYPSVQYHEPGELEMRGRVYITLYEEQVQAFVRWAVKRNPALIGQVLSEKQKEAINDAIERTEATAGECYTDASYRAVTHHLSALKSIITPEEG